MKSWIQQWLVILPGVFLAAWLIDGIEADDWGSLLLVAAVLGALNLVVKPLLIFFALPFVLLTLGIGVIFINALLLLLSGQIVPGIEIESFWSAFWGGLIISLVTMIASSFFGEQRLQRRRSVRMRGSRNVRPATRRSRRRDRDVIDV